MPETKKEHPKANSESLSVPKNHPQPDVEKGPMVRSVFSMDKNNPPVFQGTQINPNRSPKRSKTRDQ